MADTSEPVDRAMAEDALAALADEEHCERCGQVGTENGYYCASCLDFRPPELDLACPFCRQPPGADCEHLVIGQNPYGDWVILPVERIPLIDEDDVDDWQDGEIQAVFSNLAPLVNEAYPFGPNVDPITVDLLEPIAKRISTPVIVRGAANGVAAMFAEHHRDRARSEVGEIIHRLDDAFRWLVERRRTQATAGLDG